MQFGGTADETDSRAMYDACRAAGINFFDTAHVYTEGASETLLGRFIATERDRIIVATKACYDRGASRANILESLDDSRKRMGIDFIDLLYLHRWDADTPLEESFETLAGLRQSGRIGAIGVSNYAAWQVMKAQAVAARFDTRIDALQPMYNLVKRQAEVELLPMAQDQGIEVFPYSPLGGGLLTGKYASGGEGRLSTDARYSARYAQDWMHETARALADLAADNGIDAATLAVAWAAGQPGVSAPIISARNAAQLAPSLKALTVPMPAELEARITALSQKPAPATDRLEEA